MTSLSEHVSIESRYCEALENVGLYDPKIANSEKASIADASSNGLSIEDYGKEDLAHKDMKTEMHEHENNETSILGGNKCADLEVHQTNDGIRSCIDVILENISLAEKESELVDGDLNMNNREKSEARSQSTLAESVEKGQVKMDNNCDTFGVDYVTSSDEKPENINIREFCVSVKPLNTEIYNSSEQYNDACINSEKSGCNSVVVDINLKVVEIDTGKIDERRKATGNAKQEIQKHENIVDTVNCGSNCFINGDRGVKEVNVGTESHVDNLLKILNLANKETNPIHDGISVSDRESSDEASQESHKLGVGLEEDKIKNSNTFGVKATSCLAEIQDDFNKPINIEITNSGKQNIEECCNSEMGNFNSEDIDISSKNVLIDHGRAEVKCRAANNAEPEAQKDENIENSVSDEICVKNDIREVIEIKDIARKVCKKKDSNDIADDAVSEAREHQNIENNGGKHGSEKKSEFKENYFIAKNCGKSVSVIQESYILHESTEKDETRGNICITFESNADEKCKNSIRMLDTDKQDGDLCKSSEKDNFNSDINGASLKDNEKKDCKITDLNITADNAIFEAYKHRNIDDNGGNNYPHNGEGVGEINDDLELFHPQFKLSQKKIELKENNDDCIANNNGKTESVIQESCIMLHESTEKDQTTGDISITIESNADEKRKNSTRVLDTDKQDADVDHRKKELSETLKHQKSTHCNEENVVIGEISDEISIDPVVVNVNVTEKESELVNNGITANNGEKCKTVCRKVSVLRNTIRNEERRKEKTLEVTALTSKIKTFPEDSDVIVISSEGENYDFDNSVDTLNEISGENDLNTDVLSCDKFHEELDNEVEILKAQCSDIENKLATEKNISSEEKYKCSLKVRKELMSCTQSLEKLIVSLRNNWLQDKSKIPKPQVDPSCSYHQQVEPSCSYHQQYPKTPIEAPIDKYRYRSQAFTRLTKISHHHYEFNSKMPPWETVKTSHKCKKRPERFSGSEEETCKNLHKKKCMSQYSYERGFQQSPEKKNKTSKKCCLSKNCTSYRKARETEFHSYSNELDCFGGRGGFSKSFIARRELMFSKSNPRDYTNYLSYSNPTLKKSSPTDKYKSSVLKPCSRKKIGERRYKEGFNLHKFGREHDFNNDLSDSSEISSISDGEFSPIHSDHYPEHGKYSKSKHAKSVKKNEISSRKEKPKKRIKEKQYETDEMSMSSIDSDTSIEVIETSGKRHKEKAYSKHNIENKRVHNLIGRQMDFINKHVPKKGDKVEPSSFTDSNIDETCKQNYFDKEKNEEISSSEGTTPIPENARKRKNKASEMPFKHAKTSNHSDLRNILNNKHQSDSSKVKFHSRIASRSRSMSPVETNIRSPCKLAKTKLRTDSQNIFKNKYNTENCKAKLQSYIVSPSSNLPVDAMRYKNKDIDNYSTQTFGEQTKQTKKRKNKTIGSLSTQSSEEQITERNERKISRPDDKHTHKIWNDVAQKSRNEADEEHSEGEMNNIKGIESFVSFLKKKKGKYLTPPFTMLINRELEKEQETKYGPYSIDEIKRENKLPQKIRADLVYPENVPVKSKKTVRPPQISPKMTEQSVTPRPVKKNPVEDKNDASAFGGKFDLFKQLNREIRTKKVKKSATPTINADFENKKTLSKPSYPEDQNAPFNKVKEFSTKFKGREPSPKSENFLPDFQEDNGTWSD